MIYQLDFLENSRLGMTHLQSGKTIGYGDDNRLINGEEEIWEYRVLEDSSLLIYQTNKKTQYTYALLYGISTSQDSKPTVASTYRQDIDGWTENAFWLFPILYPQYTSWPFGRVIEEGDDTLENMSDIINEGVLIMNVANYCLYLKDNKKYLIPSQLVY
jgi:hypothetical protein